MKHLAHFFICFLFFAGSPFLSLAQGNSSANPPNRVQANFNAKFPDHSGATKWQETSDGYQATIRKNNKEVVSNFDKDGRWIRSRTEVKKNDIPKPAIQYLNETYEPYEYLGGYRYETKSGVRYELDIRSQNERYQLEFDKEGGFVKESTPGDS